MKFCRSKLSGNCRLSSLGDENSLVLSLLNMFLISEKDSGFLV
uniref:Uncharacterized protein n=1 Tax=Rhizophora mucronata TaxID=61149 RepID=A0A2P2N3J2_RHIMU